MKKSAFRFLVLLVLGLLPNAGSAATLELQRGDHVCLVGNALGEAMQHQNQWESLLHQRFPDLELTVRNLCFPGDEPELRIRSQNFGEPDEHLKHSGATVVLYFFGFNESFAGEAGLEGFTAQITRLVEHTRSQDYSGQGPPRVVLVSPIAFENTGDRNLPDGSEHNERLALYTAGLQRVAEQTGVGFADIFGPTQALFESSDRRLTLNGAHLNDAGYAAVGLLLQDALFGPGGPTQVDANVKTAVDDKNFHWWHRYRAVNGYSIYGARGEAGFDGTYRNRDVMEREREILDEMTANRDARIWAIAQGKPVAPEVDDSNTLPFITPKSNVGIPDAPKNQGGKLGSLEYLTSAEQLELFELAPGYEIQLFASEEQFPELANPVALQFDNRGRLWVSTMQSYPQWKPKTELDDKLLILEDHNNDGTADECKVFAGGLHQPTGFELGNGGVYVAQQPDILFLRDLDGDDRADEVTRKLVGFDTADSHHGIAAFEWGPGGNLYFQEGTFKFSQVESPYGLTRLHEAGIWVYHPKTERMGVHANFAFANPWGHVFDRWGQNFIGDASPGYAYWAAPITGRIDFPLKHPGGSQHRRMASQTGGEPDYEFPRFYEKRTRPLAGCAILSSRHFPPEVQGNFLVTNCIGDRTLLNHEIREDGSGFVGTEVEPIVSCKDGNFRPVDVQVAPDGSLYIVDWHNALIGHLQHNLREPHRDSSHGRIWRVTYPSRPLLEPAQVEGQPISELLELLKIEEDQTRYRARRELAQRETDDVITAVRNWIEALDPDDPHFTHHLLEGLWVFQTHHVIDEPLLDRLLAADDHRARAAATRVLSFWLQDLKEPMDRVRACINDSHPRVRLEAVRAVSFLSGDEAFELALEALEHDMDDYLQYALDETLRSLEQR